MGPRKLTRGSGGVQVSSPPGAGKPGGMARGCHQGGEEAGWRLGQALGGRGEYKHQAPLPETEHPPCEGELSPSEQQST